MQLWGWLCFPGSPAGRLSLVGKSRENASAVHKASVMKVTWMRNGIGQHLEKILCEALKLLLQHFKIPLLEKPKYHQEIVKILLGRNCSL